MAAADNDFLDDDAGLADLPPEELQALEQRAVLSTQQLRDGLSWDHQTLPTLPLPSAENSNRREAQSAAQRMRGVSSDYGDLDDGDDDEEVFDESLLDAGGPSATLRDVYRTAGTRQSGTLQPSRLHAPSRPSGLATGPGGDAFAAADAGGADDQDHDAEAAMHDAPPPEADAAREDGVARDVLQQQIQQVIQRMCAGWMAKLTETARRRARPPAAVSHGGLLRRPLQGR